MEQIINKDIEKFINNIFKKDRFSFIYYERMALLEAPERIYFMDSIYNMIYWNTVTVIRRQVEQEFK